MRSETSTPGVKRSKREENSIIIHFAFYFVLTAWLAIFLIINIVPKIIEIEKEKTLTKEIYNSIEIIEKKGLTFSEFKVIAEAWNKDRVVLEILKNMTEDFYNENLVNETNKSYNYFLDAKNKELNSVENKAIVDNQIKQISTILPSYSLQPIDLWWDLLTDYKFVNYVESLIETFGLSTDSSIGIKKLELVEEYLGSNEEGGSLDSNLYYIPLNLIIKWNKSGIINFLYYVENVWNIIIDEEEIKLNKDYWFLSKNGIKIILEWDKNTSDYNIFSHQMIDIGTGELITKDPETEWKNVPAFNQAVKMLEELETMKWSVSHQMIDIEKISMDEYLDSSYVDRWENDFKSFIIRNQANDEFEINVNLLFYVKGQPLYKTEEFIRNILNMRKEALKIITSRLEDVKIKEIERKKLMKDNSALSQMNKEIVIINKNLTKKDKLEESYKSAIKLNTIIEPIFRRLK